MPRRQHENDDLLDGGLMTATEVAIALRATRKAVYAMVERRQLPGVIRLGRRLLFDRRALVAWLEERRAVSPKE